jgi:hypothetical protein
MTLTWLAKSLVVCYRARAFPDEQGDFAQRPDEGGTRHPFKANGEVRHRIGHLSCRQAGAPLGGDPIVVASYL